VILIGISNKFKQMSFRAKLATALVVIFILSVVVQSIFFPSSTPLGPVRVGNLHTWTSQLGGFSIGFPENWLVHELPQGSHGDKEAIAYIVPRNNFSPQVYISQKHFPSAEIDEVVSWGEMRNAQYNNYEPKELENISTNSFTGKTLEFSISNDSPLSTDRTHCLDLYALNKTLGYQFTFCAHESDWLRMKEVFHKMIQSITFN
jgi:hypothetical protein